VAVDSAEKGVGRVNDSRRFPWLSGLLAATGVAVWLICVVVAGVMSVLGDFAAAT